MAKNEIKTGPYKWTRDLYAKLALHYGVTYEFEFKKFPDPNAGGNKQKSEYLQKFDGPDAKLGEIERRGDEIRADIEAKTRAKYPGPLMFTKAANEAREAAVRDLIL